MPRRGDQVVRLTGAGAMTLFSSRAVDGSSFDGYPSKMSNNVRIVAWNCRRASAKSAAWHYLEELQPDVALLQEVGTLPDQITRGYAVASAVPVADTGRPQGFTTAVLVKGEIKAEVALLPPNEWVARELDFFRGNFVAKHVVLPNGLDLKVISVYSPAFPVARSRLAGIDTTGIQLTQNRDVWATEILWACLKAIEQLAQDRFVVGGDFNSSETFDFLWGKKPRGNVEIMERMNTLGLRDCLRTIQGRLTPTFRTPRDGSVIHQIDHLYVTPALLNSLAACDVGAADRVFGATPALSDHLPIVADFQMTS
jgi:exonuclease III